LALPFELEPMKRRALLLISGRVQGSFIFGDLAIGDAPLAYVGIACTPRRSRQWTDR